MLHILCCDVMRHRVPGMARTWATKLFDRNSTVEMSIAIAMAIGARFVRRARHAERNFAPSLNVNAPLA